MTDTNPPYPEVFASPEAIPDPAGRTVYPPRPDADGKYALSEVLDWDAFMSQVHTHLGRTCTFVRSTLNSMPQESAERARALVWQIEFIRPLFLRRQLHLIPEQQRMKDTCGMLFSEIMVWAGQTDCLKTFAGFIAGSREKWLPFSQALVENNLQGQKDWRQAKTPVHWVKRVTNTIADKETRLTGHAVDCPKELDGISFEEIAESPIEGLLERKYSYHSIAELEAAAKEDPETAEYLSCKIRNPSWSRETITRHLQWDEKRGKRVDRRYRRLRREFRKRGVGIQCREYRPPSGISEANFTAYFEELFDGTRGRGTGVWQHRSPQT